jgi:hypothetical protein
LPCSGRSGGWVITEGSLRGGARVEIAWTMNYCFRKFVRPGSSWLHSQRHWPG